RIPLCDGRIQPTCPAEHTTIKRLSTPNPDRTFDAPAKLRARALPPRPLRSDTAALYLDCTPSSLSSGGSCLHSLSEWLVRFYPRTFKYDHEKGHLIQRTGFKLCW
ncbi:unnamed protein product, partial [Ectocarpus sp. 13 AM-2016]